MTVFHSLLCLCIAAGIAAGQAFAAGAAKRVISASTLPPDLVINGKLDEIINARVSYYQAREMNDQAA